MKLHQRIDKAFDLDIPPNPKLVLLALCRHADSTGKSWPSIQTIQQKTGLSKATIFRSLATLKKNGYLAVINRRNRSNLYFLYFPGVANGHSSDTDNRKADSISVLFH